MILRLGVVVAAAWEPALGKYHMPITASADAQRLFNVGLLLEYGFDQGESKKAFAKALLADPSCAMCHWGLAYANGPFLNNPQIAPGAVQTGYAEAHKALKMSSNVTSKERALIQAMTLRYPSDPSGNQTVTYTAYRNELGKLLETQEFENDSDIKSLYIESILTLHSDSDGYHFYHNNGDDKPPTPLPDTVLATRLVHEVLNATNNSHPLAQHMVLHATEMSNIVAATSIEIAEHLDKQYAGLQDQHLQHMPSHIYLRTGHYHLAILANERAHKSDMAFMQHGDTPYGPGHNTAFLTFCAAMSGEEATAQRYSEVLQGIYAAAPSRPDGPGPDQAWSLPMVTALRFGNWDALAALDLPPPKGFEASWPYGYNATRHFALSVSAAASGRHESAVAEQQELSRVATQLTGKYKALAVVANETASAAIAWHVMSNGEDAVNGLTRALAGVDALVYNEPPDWMFPIRSCLGEVLLQSGRAAEAEDIFRHDVEGLSFHAYWENGWSLFGLKRAMLAQPARHNASEIAKVDQRLKDAWQYADDDLATSCPAFRRATWLV
mmetsp:Transcript_56749/g.151391  ORF Transcript_56749/g.151391 Transcript_56749/m.151391 type:complete len:554 (-) Transcript_56749:155-1816(-)